MARPVTLFTGQWADLPLAKLAKKAADWGYDGLELACWGDHFDVDSVTCLRSMALKYTRYRHIWLARLCATISMSVIRQSCPLMSGATVTPRASASVQPIR